MQLGTLFTTMLLAWTVLAALGALVCRLIMINEVQSRLAEREKIPFPWASWNYFKISRLHREFFPASRVALAHRVLLLVSVLCLGTAALVAIYYGFTNPAPSRLR